MPNVQYRSVVNTALVKHYYQGVDMIPIVNRCMEFPTFFLIKSLYSDSVKVREITSRCCSGVSELKRTA